MHHTLSRDRHHAEYVRLFTNASFLVKDTLRLRRDRRASSRAGTASSSAYTDTSSWAYELDERGFARSTRRLQHPRSVFQVMKAFYARYTPDKVAEICGCTADEFVKVADLITSTGTPDKVGTILYALGWTHHSHSVQLIHAAAMLQLLLGNIGAPAAASTRCAATPTSRAAPTAAWRTTTCRGTSRCRRPTTRRSTHSSPR